MSYLNQSLMSRKATHEAIENLQENIRGNPSADWSREWMDCLSFFCSCVQCRKRLREHDIDTKMIDSVLKLHNY